MAGLRGPDQQAVRKDALETLYIVEVGDKDSKYKSLKTLTPISSSSIKET